MAKKPKPLPKPRDPASHLRSQGALRIRTVPNKRKLTRAELVAQLTRETGHD